MPVEVLIALIALLCVRQTVVAWRTPRYSLAYPILATIVAAVFYVPQSLALVDDPSTEREALGIVLFIAVASLLLSEVGWRHGVAERRPAGRTEGMEPQTWVLVGGIAAIIAVGWFGVVNIRNLPEEQTTSGQWSGPVTIYWFFGSALPIAGALAIAFRTVLGKGMTLALSVAAIGPIADVMLLGVQRTLTAHVVAGVAAAYYLLSVRKPSRVVLGCGIAIGALLIIAAGPLRAALRAEAVWTAQSTGWVEAVNAIMGGAWLTEALTETARQAEELRNSVELVHIVNKERRFGFGLAWYNELIWTFVPAQIVGQDVKTSLMAESGDVATALWRSGYVPATGSTYGGFAEAYWNVGPLAPAVFWGIGWLLGAIWRRARGGDRFAAGVYGYCLIAGLNAITGQFGTFVAKLIYLAMFVGPIFVVARLVGKKRRTSVTSGLSRRLHVHAEEKFGFVHPAGLADKKSRSMLGQSG